MPELSGIATRLRRSREFLRLSTRDVADQVGVDEQQHLSFECGDAVPPTPLLYRYSEVLKRPLDYFIGAGAWHGLESFTATFDELARRMTSPSALLPLSQFETICRDFVMLEAIAKGAPRPDRAAIPHLRVIDAPSMSKDVRRLAGVGPATPLRDLRLLLEIVGVYTFVLAELETPRGISFEDTAVGSCVLLSGQLQASELRLELATQLGVLLQHPDPAGFALELLAPGLGVSEIIGPLATAADASYVQFVFGIPADAAISRLAQLGIRATAVRLAFPVTPDVTWTCLPARFLYLAARAHEAGRITRSRLAELLRVNSDELHVEESR